MDNHWLRGACTSSMLEHHTPTCPFQPERMEGAWQYQAGGMGCHWRIASILVRDVSSGQSKCVICFAVCSIWYGF
jgi:hypothetical protein